MEKIYQNFHICLRSRPRWLPPPPPPPPSTVSLTIKYLLFFTPSLKRLLRNVNSTPKTLQFYSLVKVLQPPAFSTKGDHLNLHRQIFVTNHVDPHLMVAIEEEKGLFSHKNKQFFV